MLSPRGVLVIVSSVVTVFISSILIYQPQLFLMALFFHIFVTSYALLYIRHFRGVDERSFKSVRETSHVATYRGGVISVLIKVSSELKARFKAELRDVIPYGLIITEGATVASGFIGEGAEMVLSYKAKIASDAKRISYSHVRCVLYDPLGLVAKEVRIRTPKDLLVLDEGIYAQHEPLLLKERYTAQSPGIGVNPFVGLDEEYTGVRLYEYGDRLRDIHWKRTAQQTDDAILVKRFNKRSEAQINVIVDCSPSIKTDESRGYLEDVNRALMLIATTALEEGNPIYLYVLNSGPRGEYPLKVKISSLSAVRDALLNIYPSRRPVNRAIIDEFSSSVAKGSRIIIFTNPPSANQGIIEEMVKIAMNKGCAISIVIPELTSYYQNARAEEVKRLLDLDSALKERWLRRLGEGTNVILLSAAGSAAVLERSLRDRRALV